LATGHSKNWQQSRGNFGRNTQGEVRIAGQIMSKTYNHRAAQRRNRRTRLLAPLPSLLAILGGCGLLILAPGCTAQLPPTSASTQQVSNAAQISGSAASTEQEPTIEPSAPKPPQVTYHDDELTIVAENSRLSDVLSAVRGCIGADLDIPPNSSNERVWVRLGPGPARKVLATLLNGTSLDYVIQASDTDPDEVRSIMLTVRTKAGAGTSNSMDLSGEKSANRIPKRNQPAQDYSAALNPAPAAAAEPVASTQTPSTSTTPTGQIATAAPDVLLAADGTNVGTSGATPVSTDQMIQKLQDMYQQRKQLQAPVNAKPPGTN
jgi:hypothetical protein